MSGKVIFPSVGSANIQCIAFPSFFRDHVLQLYRGQRTFHQNVFASPARLMVGIQKVGIMLCKRAISRWV